MNSAVEIENAIRHLPADEIQAIAQWLQDYLAHEASRPTTIPQADVFAKWRGRGKLPVGKNADDYLSLTRDGHGS